MNIWLMMIIIGICTYAIRLSFIILWGKFQIPPILQSALRFVPPAILSALILPDLLPQPLGIPGSILNPRLLAGLVAIIVAWRTKNVILTVVVGMLVLLLLQTVLP